jgi:hypothetical protein
MLSPQFFLRSAAALIVLTAFTRPAMADIVPGGDPDDATTPAPATPTVIITTTTTRDEPSDENDNHPKKLAGQSFVRGFGALGASNGSVFGIRSSGVHVGGGLTVDQGPHIAVPLSVEIDHGESAGGLKMTEAACAFGLQGVIGRFRIGGGMELSHMWISRLHTSRSIKAIGAGAFVLASVDVLSFEKDRAVFIGVRPVLSWRWGSSDPFDIGSGAPTWRIAGVIGARF